MEGSHSRARHAEQAELALCFRGSHVHGELAPPTRSGGRPSSLAVAAEMDAELVTVSLGVPQSGDLGLRFHGDAPVCVGVVLPDSSASRAGLREEDMVVSVGGRDLSRSATDDVEAALRQKRGAVVTVVIGRATPTPLTEMERRMAFTIVKSKVAAGTHTSVHAYKATVGSAFAAVQDILGDLGLDEDEEEQVVAWRTPGGRGMQEVEVACGYDSDTLESPPPSDSDEEERDPLLDFSQDDQFTVGGGAKQPSVGGKAKKTAEVPSAGEIFGNYLHAKHAIEDMSGLLRGVQEKTRQKQVASEAVIRPAFAPGKANQRDRTAPSTRAPPTREQAPPIRDQAPPIWQKPDDHRWVSPSTTTVRSSSPPTEPPAPAVWPAPATRPAPSRSSHPPAPPGPTYQRAPRPPTSKIEYQRERVVEEKRPRPSEVKGRQEKAPPPTQARVGARITSKSPPPSQPWAGAQTTSGKVALRRKKSEPEVPDTGRKGLFRKPVPAGEASSSDKITDVEDVAVACRGLPENVHDWRREEVGVWLKQLSPTLYELYYPAFSKHDIIGRTLLRLTEPSLKTIGIQNAAHRQLLAMEVSRVKIQNEMYELEQLEITYL